MERKKKTLLLSICVFWQLIQTWDSLKQLILHYYHSIFTCGGAYTRQFTKVYQEESVYLDCAAWCVCLLIAVIADWDDVIIFTSPDVQILSAYPLL